MKVTGTSGKRHERISIESININGKPHHLRRNPEGTLRSLRVAVTLIGQLQRLELRSKIENLARPSEAAGVDVDFFMILRYTNSTVFSRTDAGMSDKGKGHNCSARLQRQVSGNNTCEPRPADPGYWCKYEHIHVRTGCSGNFSCVLADGTASPGIRCPPVGSKRISSACSCSSRTLGSVEGARRASAPRLACRLWSSPKEVAREMARMKANLVAAEWPTAGVFQRMAPAVTRWLSTPTARNVNSLAGDLKFTLADFRGMQYDSCYAMMRAALLIERHERRIGRLYDTVIVMRDDSIVTMPYRVPTPPLAPLGFHLSALYFCVSLV